MITANTQKNREYNLAFTSKKSIPDMFFIDRPKTVRTEAKINKEKITIQIEDAQPMTYDELQLIGCSIKLATNMTVKNLQKSLVQRFGPEIKTKTFYVVLYKIVK